ncbi:hypothetical protein CRG98_025539 [Punica granatum]|uniref:Uncharacterized protein n=1 Tax=Punica granatum TaxID=22663 RepID=A0A2I0JCS4_PUNGR|nr:hypothetical protein CRG98_025539 [Punica granatum]
MRTTQERLTMIRITWSNQSSHGRSLGRVCQSLGRVSRKLGWSKLGQSKTLPGLVEVGRSKLKAQQYSYLVWSKLDGRSSGTTRQGSTWSGRNSDGEKERERGGNKAVGLWVGLRPDFGMAFARGPNFELSFSRVWAKSRIVKSSPLFWARFTLDSTS